MGDGSVWGRSPRVLLGYMHAVPEAMAPGLLVVSATRAFNVTRK